MKTKLFALTLILIFLVPQTFAQKKRKIDSGVHFGILGGAGMQTFTGTDFWGKDLNYKFIPGGHLGGNVILSFLPDLFVQPGITISMKGARQDIIKDTISKTVILSYIEIPLNILYRPQMGNGHLLVGLGPYAGYGIIGRERTKIENITTELKVKFLSDASQKPTSYSYYKGFDAGANVFVGYEFYNGIFFQLNGQMGLIKINSVYGPPNDQTSKKNMGFGVSLGYRFF